MDAPGATGKRAPVPDWAVQVVQTTLRAYRYNGLYTTVSGPDHIQLLVRRGDHPIGELSLEHFLHMGPPERHDLRLAFRPQGGGAEERFTPHSLKQLQLYVPILVERICKHGCAADPKWCEACPEAERHQAGQFEPPRMAPT